MRISPASMAAVLLCASGLWIGEEASDGRGLHIAALWMLLAALVAVRELLGSARSVEPRFGWADAGVLLVAVGHVLSSWHIEQASGDRRAAWNLTMEWCGLAGAWYTLRTVCQNVRDRTLIMETLLTLTVGLAALGIWQHQVTFPRQAGWYQERRLALDTALRTPGGAALRQVQEITAEFGRLGVPLDGASRVLWENRLLHSTEPLGPFALTNTLAGLLAAGLIVAAARWPTAPSGLGQRVVMGLAILTLSYCLLLTKSRSAWLAAGFGLLILGLHTSRYGRLRLLVRAGLAAVGLLAVLMFGAARAGAIDREVILESPKSLQYRLFYWLGSLEMLAERPFVGAGPGNFRQAYLPHKPDESSEEIRDPHNYLLEAWSSAGLPGLTGMLLFTIAMAAALWRDAGASRGLDGRARSAVAERSSASLISPTAGQRTRFLPPSGPAVCMACGWLLDTGWEWLSADSLLGKADDLLLLAGAVLMLFRRRLPEFSNATAGFAAAAAVLVHLLASGGFGVSVVILMILVCGAAGSGAAAAGQLQAAGPTVDRSGWQLIMLRGRSGVIGAVALTAAVATVTLGIVPLMKSERALDVALALAADSSSGNDAATVSTRIAFCAAIAADPRRTGTRQAWAEYEFGRLAAALPPSGSAVGLTSQAVSSLSNQSAGQGPFAGVDEACGGWIEADPAGFAAWQLRGMARRRIWEMTGEDRWLQYSLADLDEAVRRHPGQADVWLEKAELEHAAGRTAAAAQSAARAARLNQINREWGHQDQFLSASQERRLALLGQGSGDPGGGSHQEIRGVRDEAGQKVP